MTNLDVISVNLVQILISLCNLLIIFLILKRFLYKPVKRVIDQRNAELESRYGEAEKAVNDAEANRTAWEEKMRGADAKAMEIVKNAEKRGADKCEIMISEAKKQADGIVNEAREEAASARAKARDEIKKEIVGVSTVIAEEMLKREITLDDHRAVIDDMIENIGDFDE